MAVSDNPRHRQERAWNRPLNRLSRYDLVLAVIPILFTASVCVYLFAPVSLHLAMGAGALTSALLVADALYLNPPTDGRDNTRTDDSSRRTQRGD